MATDHVIDAFLKLEGIKGESKDSDHSDEIEVLSYRHGVSQGPGSDPSVAGSLTAGRCEHEDLTVTKRIDISSPQLNLYCCNGKHIPEMVLTLHRAGGEKVKYAEIRCTDVLITSVNPWADGRAGELPSEEVTFRYGKIEWTYYKTTLSGQVAGEMKAGWDLAGNQAV